MRGCPEEGGPNAENSTLINGFYEISPIVYPEDAYGFAKTGQTICGVTDSKIIKLFVDDEPFWLPNANLLSYDRRLNMKFGTLDREILWETNRYRSHPGVWSLSPIGMWPPSPTV
jgi:alpha,alpha-trehalose phosphorylase